MSYPSDRPSPGDPSTHNLYPAEPWQPGPGGQPQSGPYGQPPQSGPYQPRKHPTSHTHKDASPPPGPPTPPSVARPQPPRFWTKPVIFVPALVLLGMGLFFAVRLSSGSGSSGAYQDGHAFGSAAAASSSTPEAAVLGQEMSNGSNDPVQYACDQLTEAPGLVQQFTPQGESIPKNELPPAYGASTTDWVNGCVAGYNAGG
jgi:hypothetical protein